MPKSVFIRIRQANINFTKTRTELHKLKEILSEFGIKEAFLKNHMGSSLNPSRENEAWHNVMTRNQTLDRFLLGFASASVSFYWDTTPELWSFWNTVSFMLASRSNRSKIGKRIILMLNYIDDSSRIVAVELRSRADGSAGTAVYAGVQTLPEPVILHQSVVKLSHLCRYFELVGYLAARAMRSISLFIFSAILLRTLMNF